MYMQALHRKLDVVLVQILPYNCSETDYSFCEDSFPAGLHPLPGCGFHPQSQTPLAPIYFSLCRPWTPLRHFALHCAAAQHSERSLIIQQIEPPHMSGLSRLAKNKFQGFPGLTKLVYKDVPQYIRFTNMAAWGQKSAHTISVISVTALQ